ncbi:hypothetical protein [Jiulongibacter sediminis]|uniref:Glycoside hydrolase family 13 n=1 Tax=Jiulongibacter sediminis TaxID=1605367 RepID=A0A0P7C6Y6_9BACT|nr:hypothetical protein [Jiulongibacter sediminis]KPM48129.1 hypothetical protein AFM12_11310 [Jiulongibacter sediminis]TBX24301.1 hypothetical protein TK44_11315 [Jiulongibacter sediminis]
MAKTKINFSLAPEIVGNASSGILLGEFNNWDASKGVKLKKAKDGSLTTAITLETGKVYEYRYLLDDGRWVNDGNADAYNFVSDFQIDNCVIEVPAPVKKAPAKKVAAKTSAKKVAVVKGDDLTKIEGVGKKIAELLVADGIDTFEKLGKATQKTLKGILEAAGPRYNIHEPKTWPKQAKLAAAGKMDELKKLQDSLKGGK